MMQHPFRLASIAMVIIFSGFVLASQRQNQPVADQPTVQNEIEEQNNSETALVMATDSIQWTAYDVGLKRAKNQNKPVFIEFFATWCGYCKKMDKEVFSNPEVQKLMDQYFISARITESSDHEVLHENQKVTEKKLTSIYGVTGFPTLMFLDSEGKEIAKLPGFIGPDEMSLVLKFIGTKAYQKMDFPTFKKKSI